jgi:hypothetical protein
VEEPEIDGERVRGGDLDPETDMVCDLEDRGDVVVDTETEELFEEKREADPVEEADVVFERTDVALPVTLVLELLEGVKEVVAESVGLRERVEEVVELALLELLIVLDVVAVELADLVPCPEGEEDLEGFTDLVEERLDVSVGSAV